MIARRIAAVLLVAGLAAASVVWLSCQGPSSTGGTLHVVKLDGATSARNASLSVLLWTTGEPGKRPAYAAARDGDILLLDEVGNSAGFVLRYRAADGDALAVSYDAGRGMIGGKTVSVFLKEDAAWDWLAKAAPADLKAIRLLWLESAISDDHVKVLQDVAKVNPNIDLALKTVGDKTTPEALVQAVAPFRPRFLSIDPAFLKDPKPLMPVLSGIEVLWLDGEGKGLSLDFLKDMPRLERLQLPEGVLGNAALPADLKNLRALLVSDKDLKDLSALAPLTGLEELSVLGESVTDVSAVAKLSHLHVLSLAGCPKVADVSSLKGLPLTWLSLPPGVTQEGFNALIADHPGLEGVEVVAAGKEKFKNLRSIEPLKNLHSLRFLVLTSFDGEPKAVEDLKQMKGLRMLVLSEGMYAPEKAADRQDLQKALPNTVITEGAGICLGSGWILALVPLVAGAAALAALRRRRRAVHAS